MRRVALGLLAAVGLLPGAAAAQGWSFGVGAGQADYRSVSADVGTQSAIFELRHAGPRWLYLSAGAPLDEQALPWGAAGLGGRFLSGGGTLAVGVDLGAHVHAYRDRTAGASGSGATVEALPLVAVGGGPARLELRSGLLYHGSTYAGETVSRAVHENGARLVLGGAAVAVSGEGRYVRAEEGGYPYAGAAVELLAGAGQLWGYAGRWLSDAVTTPSWGAGASLPLGGRTSISASFQQEAEDPLYWNPPRRSWNVGLSHSFGRRAATAPPPVPLVPEVTAGSVTIRLPASESPPGPSVAGSFTGWQPVPMRRVGEFWVATLPVPSGVHRYAFRDAEGNWFVPHSVPGRTEDELGVAAVLVVP